MVECFWYSRAGGGGFFRVWKGGALAGKQNQALQPLKTSGQRTEGSEEGTPVSMRLKMVLISAGWQANVWFSAKVSKAKMPVKVHHVMFGLALVIAKLLTS